MKGEIFLPNATESSILAAHAAHTAHVGHPATVAGDLVVWSAVLLVLVDPLECY